MKQDSFFVATDQLSELRKRTDILLRYPEFDANRYEEAYPDVKLSNLSPEEHYCMFGMPLGREIESHDGESRGVSESLKEALLRKPTISFCISIMNRPDDVRGTLKENLDNNREFENELEFLLLFLDDDKETHHWVTQNFEQDLRSGYLRMIVDSKLDSWHFGRAKNRHRNYATGRVFSSLDGDNFVTPEEVSQLLEIYDRYGDKFVFHHFSGIWGDGSSGRVSVPIDIYRDIGYDDSFLPRQYDEVDFIISALTKDIELPFIRRDLENHVFSSSRASEFLKLAGISNPTHIVDAVPTRPPLNPKADSYVSDDKIMGKMQEFNQFLCYMKNSPTAALRSKYLSKAVQARHGVIDVLPKSKIISTLFKLEGTPLPENILIQENDVSVFACMKNDDLFVEDFYQHHKSIGVSHFFIVDDGSDVPIRELLPYPDVHVFRPKVGSFITSKGMWIDGLIKAYLSEGQWALTLDADERLDLPAACGHIKDVLSMLAAREKDFAPALLIDLVPGSDVSLEDLADIETSYLTAFDHYVSIDEPVGKDYSNYRPIQWAFGPYVSLSWKLDTRYHAFGTFDALRKTPLARFKPQQHVNQGFHTLHYSDDRQALGNEIWDTDFALIIRHYKLLKLFSESARSKMLENAKAGNSSQYHARTTENIAQIFDSSKKAPLEALMALPSAPLADGILANLSPKDFLAKP